MVEGGSTLGKTPHKPPIIRAETQKSTSVADRGTGQVFTLSVFRGSGRSPPGGDDVTKEYHVITGKMVLPGVQSKPSCPNPNEDHLQSKHVGLKRTTVN
ncbi:hypothetical protein NQZ68_012595 [Dissostichus eleginoides]|nr:hypothetical protein NQZ68_012595 [Dissostichus eleginoides]